MGIPIRAPLDLSPTDQQRINFAVAQNGGNREQFHLSATAINWIDGSRQLDLTLKGPDGQTVQDANGTDIKVSAEVGPGRTNNEWVADSYELPEF